MGDLTLIIQSVIARFFVRIEASDADLRLQCSSCGHAQDALQKVSDAPLTICPQCQTATLSKQLTAAGFQLRGSGWYATDFKNGSGKPSSASDNGTAEPKGDRLR